MRDYLAGVECLTAIGAAVDGREAVTLIDRCKPDLVFLDVRMPDLSGLEAAPRIGHRPFIVSQRPIRPSRDDRLRTRSLNYLLKPFSRKRFSKTIERIRDHIILHGGEPQSLERVQ